MCGIRTDSDWKYLGSSNRKIYLWSRYWFFCLLCSKIYWLNCSQRIQRFIWCFLSVNGVCRWSFTWVINAQATNLIIRRLYWTESRRILLESRRILLLKLLACNVSDSGCFGFIVVVVAVNSIQVRHSCRSQVKQRLW